MWCPKCEGYTVDIKFHQCPPTWRVRLLPYHGEDDYDEVLANSAQQAAQKFAEQYDQGGDYTVVGGSPIEVLVSGHKSENEKKYHVEGEAVATYYAQEVKSDPSKDPTREGSTH